MRLQVAPQVGDGLIQLFHHVNWVSDNLGVRSGGFHYAAVRLCMPDSSKRGR
jgi:hypothetical protein